MDEDYDNIEDKISEIDENEKLSEIDDEEIELKKTKSGFDEDDDVIDDTNDEELDDDDEDEEEADDDVDEVDYANKAFVQSDNIENTDMLDLDDDDDDDSDDDFDNFEKFQQSTSKNVIKNHYPELLSHNYEEIEHLSKVIRNDAGRIIDPFHKTLPFLSRYERARIIGERSKQLDNNAQPFVDLEPNEIDSYTIAMKEFQLKRIPFIIKRPLPNGTCEYWKLSDLEVI